MLSLSRKQLVLFFGWSIILSFVTLPCYCARAITVSHSPCLADNIKTQQRRQRHQRITEQQSSLRPISLRRRECPLLLSSRRHFQTYNDHDNNDIKDNPNDDDDDEILVVDDYWLLDTRGGASSPTTTTKRARTSSSATDTKKARHTENAWVDGLKNSLASALAAAFSKTILAPFDTIKTLQQYHQTSSSMPSLTLLEAAKTILERPGGFLNFYAGLGVSVLGAMPSVAMYFGTYSYCKKTLSMPRTRPDGTTYTLPRTFVIGMSAAIGNTFASFSRVPYEVLKQKLQTNTYRNTLEAIRDITSWDMIFPKGGVTIQMMRDIPYAVVTLLLYEHLQAWNSQRKRQQQQLADASSGSRRNNKNGGNNNNNAEQLQQASSDMILGAISGGMGSWVTNPLDVIKTRLQTAPFEVYEGSISKCIAETWNEGGGMAFLRGSWPRLMHKIPANGFFFLFYEFFRRVLRCQGYDDDDDN